MVIAAGQTRPLSPHFAARPAHRTPTKAPQQQPQRLLPTEGISSSRTRIYGNYNKKVATRSRFGSCPLAFAFAFSLMSQQVRGQRITLNLTSISEDGSFDFLAPFSGRLISDFPKLDFPRRHKRKCPTQIARAVGKKKKNEKLWLTHFKKPSHKGHKIAIAMLLLSFFWLPSIVLMLLDKKKKASKEKLKFMRNFQLGSHLEGKRGGF